MTRAQRRRHLVLWSLVGPASLLLIALALSARGPAHLAESTPATPEARP